MNQLEKITKRAVALREEQRALVEGFNTYSEGISAQVKSLLEEAGVYSKVHALETAREEQKKAEQKKVDAIVEKLKDLQKSYELLSDLEAETEVVEEPVAEVIEAVPVVEAAPVVKKAKKESVKKAPVKKEVAKKVVSKKKTSKKV